MTAILHPADATWRLWTALKWGETSATVLAVLGLLLLALFWLNRHEVYLGYFGGVCLGWTLLSLQGRAGLENGPVVASLLFCLIAATLAGLTVQFLLSYAGLRSRVIEAALLMQLLIVPSTALAVGGGGAAAVTATWCVLLFLEVGAAGCLFLVVSRRTRRQEFWPMLAMLGSAAALLIDEFVRQDGSGNSWPTSAPLHPSAVLMPIVLVAMAWRLFLMFARALRTSQAACTALTERVRELTMEFELSLSQMADLRVAKFAESERKRIAADLHDDIGAKLLTIVHSSESERIAALAREALDEMRLSVKGLIGKPMKLADAIADWRAEIVERLVQADIPVAWHGLDADTDLLLPSRGFVQTTRILREAVSNIVRHSGARNCSVHCRIVEGYLALTIRDDGRGIPAEIAGRLDRGLGMSNMKRRAKQIAGQCLVKSGPGYGTVIAVTVPL